jgi:hypothetical protein
MANLSRRSRAATNGGWALGDARFAQQIADAVGRRAAQTKLTPIKAATGRRAIFLMTRPHARGANDQIPGLRNRRVGRVQP